MAHESVQLTPWIQLAGALQLAVASANLFAPRLLHYRENAARLDPLVRKIFLVHNIYIGLTVVGLAMVCLLFPGDLAGGGGLGRFLTGFLGSFWGLRLAIQVGYYGSPDNLRPFHVAFTAVFLYLFAVFCLAALKR